LIQIITHAGHVPDEPSLWLQLLNEGADSILVRKPGWPAAEYEILLQQADPACYAKLIIAEHAELCSKYGLKGLHLNETLRALTTPAQLNHYHERGWWLSTSIHSAETIRLASNTWSQLLLSPVFNSISKPGYNGTLEKDFRLNKAGFEGQVFALGGIDHITAGLARHMQFDGIALLGAIWQRPEKAVRNFCRIRDLWNTH
jgi:thiamine-phosphate pyrophosphorylase